MNGLVIMGSNFIDLNNYGMAFDETITTASSKASPMESTLNLIQS